MRKGAKIAGIAALGAAMAICGGARALNQRVQVVQNPADDTDGDGLPNVLDVDSDNDGLFDGTEAGKDCMSAATNASLGHCIADADPATTTWGVDADSDNGGASDGSEDPNRNGADRDPRVHAPGRRLAGDFG